jgi:hypothetical protein
MQVINQLEKVMIKNKDTLHMNYYKIEGLINKDDQDYTHFQQLFGYKCNYTRDPCDTKYLMEVYIPILKVAGKKKIVKKFMSQPGKQ